MLNNVQSKLNKGFIKTKDLQQKIFELRQDDPTIKPVDAAHALLAWFQEPDNEFIRLDVLKYAVSHMWSTVGAKIDEDAISSVITARKAAKPTGTAKAVSAPTPVQQARVAKLVSQAQAVSAVSQLRKQQVAEAADKAVEQIVSTLKLMTFKQARMLNGAMASLDLSRGSDDQLLGEVFSDAEIRSAVK